MARTGKLAWNIAIFGILISTNGLSAQATEPVPRETWEVVYAGDAAFGSIHTSVAPLPMGGLRAEQQTRYLVDLLGQRQEIVESREWIVDAARAPVSFRYARRGQGGEMTAVGKISGRQLHTSITQEGTTIDRDVELPEDAFFSVFLPERLARLPVETQQAQIATIEEDSGQVKSVRVERAPTANRPGRWRVGESLWTLNAAGERVEVENPAMDRSTRVATVEEAGRIDYLKMSPRELLMFPMTKDLPFPEHAQKVVVRLAWSDFPLESMDLEDTRQKIVAHEQQAKRVQVDLELTQPPTIAHSPAIPVDDPTLAPYLADDDLIDPSNAAIRAKAKEWTAGSTTTLAALRALSRQVSEHMQGGEMIAETLPGSAVLACRKGKCTEFTTLLASLARSVGVPTRVALGMRLSGGQWVGHMWCEAWVGQWIPVDATADEVGGSPALLKLTHSASVMGTQKVRWAMTKSLEVEVMDFESGARTDLGLKTGIVRQLYTNADFACRITAPDGWSWLDTSEPGVPKLRCQPPARAAGGDEPLIHFVAFSLPTKMDVRVLVNARKARFLSMYKMFKILTDEPQPVGAAAGRLFCFERQNPQDATKMIKTTEYIWTQERSGYILNIIAEPSQHDALLADFQRLFASFESLGPTAKKP